VLSGISNNRKQDETHELYRDARCNRADAVNQELRVEGNKGSRSCKSEDRNPDVKLWFNCFFFAGCSMFLVSIPLKEFIML